jgi:hypothetical protein
MSFAQRIAIGAFRILHLEDEPADHELAREAIAKDVSEELMPWTGPGSRG